MDILGFKRPNGQIGIRNHVAVIYSVACSKHIADRIAGQFQGTQVFGRRNDCAESKPMFDKMVALGQHQNIAAVLVVGLGCEYNDAPTLAAEISKCGKRTEFITITECGGTLKTINEGTRILRDILQEVDQIPRDTMSIKDLVVGVDCAGSDATSGLASNPALGVASDKIIQAGGTVYCFNVDHELVGMENEYVSRAANENVAKKLRKAIPNIKASSPSQGNINGGITTAKEKAIGAFAKAGSMPISGVVDSFDRPQKPGLYLEVMVPDSFEDYSDMQCAMQMAACGAHIVVETTGIGTVTGGVVAATMKVSANPKTCSMLGDDLDIDASSIMTGVSDIQDVGEQIYQEILTVAAGKKTKSEILGHFED